MQLVQRCTTSSEFEEWREYLAQDRAALKPEQVYLAQIAAEVRRGRVSNPRSVKLEHFFLDFTPRTVKTPQTEAERKAHIAQSKAYWLGMVSRWKEEKKVVAKNTRRKTK